MPQLMLTRFSCKWILGSQLWHKEPYHMFTHHVFGPPVVMLQPSLMALLNASLECSGIDTRRAVCALSSTKHMLEQCSTEINTPSEQFETLVDPCSETDCCWWQKHKLSDHLGSSCTTILSDSFHLYFCGCFSLCPWPVYLKTVWSILFSCSQKWLQNVPSETRWTQALNVIVCGCE